MFCCCPLSRHSASVEISMLCASLRCIPSGYQRHRTNRLDQRPRPGRGEAQRQIPAIRCYQYPGGLHGFAKGSKGLHVVWKCMKFDNDTWKILKTMIHLAIILQQTRTRTTWKFPLNLKTTPRCIVYNHELEAIVERKDCRCPHEGHAPVSIHKEPSEDVNTWK